MIDQLPPHQKSTRERASLVILLWNGGGGGGGGLEPASEHHQSSIHEGKSVRLVAGGGRPSKVRDRQTDSSARPPCY